MEVMKWVRRKWRSHLQFADDSLFIAKSTIQNDMCIKIILRWFEVVLGLKVMRIRGSDVCRGSCSFYSGWINELYPCFIE